MVRFTMLTAASLLVVTLSACAADEQPRVHEAYTLTSAELAELLHEVDPVIRGRIMGRPWYFLRLLDSVLGGPEDRYALVDKDHALPSTYEPADLVPLTNYQLALNRTDLRLRRAIMPDVLAMNEAAALEGIRLVFSSTYRSYEYQRTVYERHVRVSGQEHADRVSARPGHSQHQLGTTIDFGSITDSFGDTPAGKWLRANAWEYGFSLSYPEGMEHVTGYRHEIWHYRYVGRTGALLEREFFGSIQQYMLEFVAEYGTAFRSARIRP